MIKYEVIDNALWIRTDDNNHVRIVKVHSVAGYDPDFIRFWAAYGDKLERIDTAYRIWKYRNPRIEKALEALRENPIPKTARTKQYMPASEWIWRQMWNYEKVYDNWV